MNAPYDDDNNNGEWEETILDVGGLAPPEPMVRVLDALDHLGPHHRLCVLIDREPHPLYGILEKNGYAHRTTARADYRYEVRIWEPVRGALPGQAERPL
ncbi:hypothetical protein CSQ96_21315 [Janthinobacterium sp. BJB412]|nr:hypothetical protein CSQ96_21315 [Janthinobacterium sp. BJB412]